jgi:hypothetical protein
MPVAISSEVNVALQGADTTEAVSYFRLEQHGEQDDIHQCSAETCQEWRSNGVNGESLTNPRRLDQIFQRRLRLHPRLREFQGMTWSGMWKNGWKPDTPTGLYKYTVIIYGSEYYNTSIDSAAVTCDRTRSNFVRCLNQWYNAVYPSGLFV